LIENSIKVVKLPSFCRVTGINILRKANRMKIQDIISILDKGTIQSAKTYNSYTLKEVQSIIDTFSPKVNS
jgi:hypothetical protein